MSYLIPVNDISPEKRERHRGSVLEALTNRQKNLYGDLPNFNLPNFTRELLPQDLGLSSWETPGITQMWAPWVNYITSPETVLAIYKLTQLHHDPNISQIRVRNSCSVFGVHDLNCCYGGLPIIKNLQLSLLDPTTRKVLEKLSDGENFNFWGIGIMEGWFSEPYIIDGDRRLIIEISGRKASRDQIVLGGFIIERRGTTVS